MQNITRSVALGVALLFGMTVPGCGGDPASVAIGPTHYEITIPADDSRVAIVRATLVPDGRDFYMFWGAGQLPAGWATFVSDFSIADENGEPVSFYARDDGTWRLSDAPDGPVTISYRVNLDHEEHEWSGGVDGAAYWRDWGVFYTARSLFVVNGEDRENIRVQFRLPAEWQVTTPWEHSDGDAMGFVVPNHAILATSMFFAGTHKEVVVQHGDFELLLTLGGAEILAREDEFTGMAGGILDYYVELMGGEPRLRAEGATNRSVVIINEAEITDGEAIGNNISMMLEPAGDPMSQMIARFIFAHEFFHLWNGKSFVPESEDSEWFKEGFSNYYTLKALHHIGVLNDDSYLATLGDFFYQRYDTDDGVGRLSMTDGSLKHEHWGLIYGGGLLVAIAQDLQIRAATGNERSLDDLMRHMFDVYTEDHYDNADVERVLDELSGTSQEDFFDRYVRGVERLPIGDFLTIAGIEAVQENGRTVFRTREDSDQATNEIRRGMFGE